jgi:hypothetical protein
MKLIKDFIKMLVSIGKIWVNKEHREQLEDEYYDEESP